MEEQPKQTGYRHPKHDCGIGINRLNFHLLAAQPKLGSRGWSDLGRSRAVVTGCLCVQSEHEH
jgi:hypothetical protein